VKNRPCTPRAWLFSSKLWCAQVTVTPDASRIAVFSSGICNGLNGETPIGGHVDPSSVVGGSLLWIKKNTSEIMNRIIAHRRPLVTIFVCNP
jgi:hypothetical protein